MNEGTWKRSRLTGYNGCSHTSNVERSDMVARTTFRYRFKVGGKVVYFGITSDLVRREHEHRRRWPTGCIEQVGPPTTREEAWEWERKQTGQRFSSAS